MNDLMKMWNDITEELVKEEHGTPGSMALVEKFSEIFDIKDVYEYKTAVCVDPCYSPRQFAHLSQAMKRAFIEGYVLAQRERKKADAALLYSCYKQDILENKNEEADSKSIIDSIMPRRSVS